MSVARTQELADSVRDAVETGDYASTSEVIREALREWKARRFPLEHDVEDIRRHWQEGLASGPGQHRSIAEIKKAARRRSGKAAPHD